LEFDELRGEAGMVTRLEAFSDSVASYRNEHVNHQ
jgi:predicted nucleotide-binding protein (sugar kinase/HSP70/actin superfamily)